MTTTAHSPSEIPAPEQEAHPERLRVVPLRHPGRWVGVAVVVILTLYAIDSFVSNPRFEWSLVAQYFPSQRVVSGVLVTMELTVASMVLGVLLGVVLAVMGLSPNPVLSGASKLYVFVFRGTPVLVQLLFWYFISSLYPAIRLGVPFTHLWTDLASTRTLIPTFVAAVLGLGLNEAAYVSEIVRAGIMSVDPGQSEAAQAMGMTHGQTLGRIVLPQAMRVILPPLGNETISMLKTTSLVLVISLSDLLTVVGRIYSRNFQEIPLLIVAVLWYLLLTAVLSVGQYFLEKRFGRSDVRQRVRRKPMVVTGGAAGRR
jgi:polar amino acid transport system permease protein